MDKAAKIFLCHSSKDKSFVRRLASDLDLKSVPVWFDEWELQVGDSLIDKISSGITESSWLAVVLSRTSVLSNWVKKELNTALIIELEKKQVFVLPILLEDCDVPIFLRDKVFADFRNEYIQGLSSLLRRLVPEERYFLMSGSEPGTPVIKPPARRPPEHQLINIVDASIVGKDDKYRHLFKVVFFLDKAPDDEWATLFGNPTQISLTIHPAQIVGNEIHWQASEEDIKLHKHWIYDWVEDANNRFLQVLQIRMNQQEKKHRELQVENVKIAELENLLKVGREGVLIRPTDVVMVGLCSLRLEGCTAQNLPSPITQVNFEHQGIIHLCFSCLKYQLESGHWRTEREA